VFEPPIKYNDMENHGLFQVNVQLYLRLMTSGFHYSTIKSTSKSFSCFLLSTIWSISKDLLI